MRVKTLIAAAVLAVSVATPALCETQQSSVSRGFVAPQASVLGLRRNIGGRGVALRWQPITTQSALALSASTGNRKELPEVRVLLGVQYLF